MISTTASLEVYMELNLSGREAMKSTGNVGVGAWVWRRLSSGAVSHERQGYRWLGQPWSSDEWSVVSVKTVAPMMTLCTFGVIYLEVQNLSWPVFLSGILLCTKAMGRRAWCQISEKCSGEGPAQVLSQCQGKGMEINKEPQGFV